ncbi:MAG: glucose-1-phosphate adenylyltransferase [Opitutae bacterium]|nr:glucose-1-phosphate adenylyltransferase [Opitutae bacterium]
MRNDKSVLSVIMGGGRGTRLYPLTMERCKPAVPLAGKFRLVDIPISNCINSGFNRIFLLTQFHTASLHRHIQSTYHFDSFGGGFVDILSAEQTEKTSDWYQGTADAVRRNLVHFRTFPHDLVLILSGDQLYKMDFHKVVERHIAAKADVTIAAIPFPVSKVEGLGLMRVNDDLSIAQFVEKPKDPAVIQSFTLSDALETTLSPSTEKRCLASMGIYVFNRAVLAEALENSMKDFGREVIPSLLNKKRLFAHIFEGYWEDIGTVRAFFEANLALTQPLPQFNFYDPLSKIYTHGRHLPATKINRCDIDHALIGEGSIITEASLRRCIVGIRSYLGEQSRLEEVVMMGADYYESEETQRANVARGIPQIGVARGCRIRRAIIDKNARIGEGCVLSPDGKPDGAYAGGAVIIRDGILVVPKSGIIPAGTVV